MTVHEKHLLPWARLLHEKVPSFSGYHQSTAQSQAAFVMEMLETVLAQASR